MSSIETKIKNAKQNGYSLDLGEVISQSIENYKKTALTAGTAILALSLIIATLVFTGISFAMGFENFAAEMTGFTIQRFSAVSLLFYILGSAVFGALMYPMTAGLIAMSHEAEMNREINFSMIFDYYKSSHFKTLFTAGFFISVGTNVLSVPFQYINLEFLGAILTYSITFLAVFAIPLIIFGKQNALDAIFGSFTLVIKQPFVILIALLVSAFIAMVGIIALCIGIFFTLPILYSTYYILYKNVIGIEQTNEMDEIGISSEM